MLLSRKMMLITKICYQIFITGSSKSTTGIWTRALWIGAGHLYSELFAQLEKVRLFYLFKLVQPESHFNSVWVQLIVYFAIPMPSLHYFRWIGGARFIVHTILLGFLKPRRLAPPRFLILAISGYAAKAQWFKMQKTQKNPPRGELEPFLL